MSWLRRLFNIVRSNRISRDIERERDFHIAERIDELRARGIPERAARDLARRQFGNFGTQAEETREADIAGWVQSVAGDVRYGFRALRRSPVFATVAILSLGLGIGANTTIFTLLDSLVLRQLPVARPHELAQVTFSAVPGSGSNFTNPLWEQIRDRQDVFSALAAYGETTFNLAEGGEARRVPGAYVSGDFFTTFLAQPAVGRLFVRADDTRGCAGVAVLGYRFWQRGYGGSRDVVGRTISLNGKPFEVIGVAESPFRGPEVGREADVYAPICSEALVRGTQSSLERRSTWWLQAIGRLKPGVTLAQASTRLAAIAPAAYAETVPQNWGAEGQKEYLTRSIYAHPGGRGLSALRSEYRPALYALMAGVGLVLLIACANVANLLLSRAEARRPELAIRMAIGAARTRLVRQLLTESVLLAVAGALVGLAIAQAGAQAMVGLISASGARDAVSLDLAVNWRLLAFTVAVTGVTVIIFGLLPAWRATRVDVQSAMKSQGRGVVTGRPGGVLGRLLVVTQVALSLVLVVSAALFLGTFRNLARLDPGFTPQGILIVDVDLRRTGIDRAQYPATERSIVERLRAIPGVEHGATVAITPVAGSSWNDIIVLNGEMPKDMEQSLSWFNEVSAGFFSTMDTRLLAGRDFDASDTPGAGKTVIVNDAFARKFFGDANPLGRTFQLVRGDALSAPYTVVGLVENAKYRSLRESVEPVAYLPSTQATESGGQATVLLRTAGNPATLTRPVREAMRDVHPAITLDFRTLSTVVSESLQRERMLAILSGLFGALAIGLAMLGLYGVMSYAVVRRRMELGVRLALGASRAQVVRMVLGEVTRIVLLGVLVGAAAALMATKLTTAFLYDMKPTEPGVYVLAAGLMTVVALAAGWVPAWRASRVDPLQTLREQ